VQELQKGLKAAKTSIPATKVPTPKQVRAQLDHLEPLLKEVQPDLLPWLRALAPRIEVYPVVVTGAPKPALEARFDVNLLQLLPAEWAAFLRERSASMKESQLPAPFVQHLRLIVTDLPKYVQIAPEAKRLCDSGMTQRAAAKKLGCSATMLCDALKLMEMQGSDELGILDLDSLPDRRRKNHPDRQVTTEKVIRGSNGLTEGIVQTVRELTEQNYTPHGIALKIGCRISTVHRALAWDRRQKRIQSRFGNARPARPSSDKFRDALKRIQKKSSA